MTREKRREGKDYNSGRYVLSDQRSVLEPGYSLLCLPQARDGMFLTGGSLL